MRRPASSPITRRSLDYRNMLTLFRWLSRWPLWLLHTLGGVAGWLSYLLSPSYRRRFVGNAAQAGISLHDARPAIAEAGRLLFELPYLWMRPPDQKLEPTVRWLHGELVDTAHERG